MECQSSYVGLKQRKGYKLDLCWENYQKQSETHWPAKGKHILAHYNDDSVVVYQAFNKDIANYAVEHQRFGGSKYSWQRMSWIKTNYMWMMYRCGWCTKKNQEHVLAITISREGFERILSIAYTPQKQKEHGVEKDKLQVRLQWDPDHDPKGVGIPARRAIQLGLTGQILHDLSDGYILNIADISEKVKEEALILAQGGINAVNCPSERPYLPKSQATHDLIGLDR